MISIANAVMSTAAMELELFHGTASKFDVLKPSTNGFYGAGIYFTDRPAAARMFAEDAGDPQDARVVRAKVTMRQPYVLHAPPAIEEATNVTLIKALFKDDARAPALKAIERIGGIRDEISRHLIALGYDSLIIKMPEGETEFIAFTADQVEILDHRHEYTNSAKPSAERPATTQLPWHGYSPVVEDDGDMPGARFVESEDGAYMRFGMDVNGRIRLQSMAASSTARGREMVRWLKETYGRDIMVDEVDLPAAGFWAKMQDEGLIAGWEHKIFRGATVPVETRIKAAPPEAAGDVGSIRYSHATWRSVLTSEVANCAMKASQASGWLSFIDGLAKKGVKAAEIEWSGVREWLVLQEGKVSKDQVMDYLAGNGVKVVETMFGDNLARAAAVKAERQYRQMLDAEATVLLLRKRSAPDGPYVGPLRTEAAAALPGAEQDLARLKADYVAAKHQAETLVTEQEPERYKEHTLPGGDNYRELLLTLPETKPSRDDAAQAIFKLDYDQLFPSQKIDADKLLESGQMATSGSYLSNHWKIFNVLAHVRFNERVDADGGKVLFVEEIQSDWAQDGKKAGFRPSVARLAKLEPSSPEAIMALGRGDFGAMRHTVDNGFGQPVTQTLTAQRMAGDKRVAPGPYVESTTAWVQLAIKRMISYAALNNFDKVAFITGEQCANRFDLSKQIDAIHWTYTVEGTYNITAIKGDIQSPGDSDVIIDKEGLTADELADHIGKEIAQKLIDKAALAKAEGTESKAVQGSLENIDLKVFGDGLKAFYDKIMTTAAKDVLKKLGGNGLISLEVGEPDWTVFGRNGQVLESGFSTEGKARQAAQGYRGITVKNEGGPGTQPGFVITPALRQQVEVGLPLFSFAGMSSATANLGRRLLAKEMTAHGETGEAARRATGWHEGNDSKWRYEISDHEARLLPTLQSLRTGGYESKPIASVTYLLKPDGTYDLSLNPANPQKVSDFVTIISARFEILDAFLPEDLCAKILLDQGSEDFLGNLQEAKRIEHAFEFEGFNALPLDEALYHPALFAAYPALRTVMVQVDPKLGSNGSMGLIEDGTRIISMGVGMQLSVLLHEIQHIIQDIENFARGALPSTVGYKAYMEAAGEVEARNTEARRALTPELRRQIPPETTADVPPGNIQLSPKPIAANPITDIERVKQAIAGLLRIPGDQLPAGRGKIVVVNSDYVPATTWLPLTGALNCPGATTDPCDPWVEGTIAETLIRKAQAFHDPVTRTTGFVADRIPPGREVSVFLHEMTHKYGRSALTERTWHQLISTLKSWENAPACTIESKIYVAANRRALKHTHAAPADLRDEELFAYAVEECVQRGIEPSATAEGTTAEKWLSAVVTSLYKMTMRLTDGPAPELTGQDIVDLAYALAQLETPEHADRITAALWVMNEQIADMTELARDEDEIAQAESTAATPT